MMTAKAGSHRSPLKTHRATTVRVTVLHEDLFTAMRAKSLADCVTAYALAGVKIKFDFWDFQFLRDPMLRQKAARQSRESAIVVVSARGPLALPWELECCIAAWFQYDTRKSRAFAILFADPEAYTSRSRAVLSYWSTAAKGLGLDFYCEACVLDIRNGATVRSLVLTQQSPVAMDLKGIKKRAQISPGKMQYASGFLNSAAHCNPCKSGAIQNNPNFTGPKGPI